MRVTLLSSSRASNEVLVRVAHPDERDTDADLIAEYAGRICYQSWHKPNPATRRNTDYLANILEQGHHSVLEHTHAAFLIEGVSRHLLGELTRHRHAGFSVESLRYCPPRDYTLHPTLAEQENPMIRRVLQESWRNASDHYDWLYKYLIASGYKIKEAREAAAQVLPLNTSTDLVASANLRGWRDLLSKRLDLTANREIRRLAERLLAELRTLAPNSVQDITLKEQA
ncbi:FAD-dependent thymidylate synthase [Nonomuraea sp. NPDC059023]|uniref:FAD-dependent thymidylate synthase n=1 Tax=unclassified Nonomuraea TaxID=2593643 RepID=UPI0036CB0958